MNQQQMENKFKAMGQAYQQLQEGSETLLEIDGLFWTEKLLLRIVNRLYYTRLNQLGEILRDEPEN